jgi:transcriptional regulator with XRE-family HTH domain
MNKKVAKKKHPRSVEASDIALGKKIRLRRIEQKLSQQDLGVALGVSFQQVQKYEKGVNRVSSGRLQQIADILGVHVTFFYDGDKRTREVESLLFLDSHFSMKLLKAYSAIQSQEVQRAFVGLMEAFAVHEHGATT